MSIRDHYVDLKPLDPRIVITWEDAGTLPFTYDPVAPQMDTGTSDPYSSFQATVDYAKELAKGWIQLPWETSEHHGPYIMGERDPRFIRKRLADRQPRWDYVNKLWQENYPLAARFYRELLACSPKPFSVTALVEDGMFEEAIQPSVALYAQTLWDPHRSDKDLLELSASPYYRR